MRFPHYTLHLRVFGPVAAATTPCGFTGFSSNTHLHATYIYPYFPDSSENVRRRNFALVPISHPPIHIPFMALLCPTALMSRRGRAQLEAK
ncbi:uncharacterized protein BDR25DRAFT_80824 [Lindgomyces ingoldianus]|uniref:Uncharacterized protein n=1 Tax=Lindgomyces ingoldianus TaxID=673940 RepID=A0ACB6QH53_9PLEO|nr:uncharacterized protein BDR25DRAFT_80824 [Lindgomyces ingoldianus]KAF2465893.1 hypothetical protein BDR25DRAFT_80824 [Lindgomyces ingoldianus]